MAYTESAEAGVHNEAGEGDSGDAYNGVETANGDALWQHREQVGSVRWQERHPTRRLYDDAGEGEVARECNIISKGAASANNAEFGGYDNLSDGESGEAYNGVETANGDALWQHREQVGSVRWQERHPTRRLYDNAGEGEIAKECGIITKGATQSSTSLNPNFPSSSTPEQKP
ncbi:MAG: hypothetical protein LQ348_002660 [Seirophora lacunosa]|nr:MAG: hypothetical protein LQ348_002660 [Seirophora lacunosa]